MGGRHYDSEETVQSFAEVTSASDGYNTQGNASLFSDFGLDSSGRTDNYKLHPDSSFCSQDVAMREQKAVDRSKKCVGLFLLLVAIATSITIFQQIRWEERKGFENQFLGYTDEITIVTRQKVDQLFSALKSFSVSASSEAIIANRTWPFFTIQDWSVKCHSLRELIGVSAFQAGVSFSPIVDEADIEQWNQYSILTAPAWYQESIEREGLNVSVDELMALTTPLVHYFDSENLFRLTATESETALPIWQTDPLGIEPVTKRAYANIDLLKLKEFNQLFFLTNATLNASIGSMEFGQEGNETVVASQIMQPIFRNPDTRSTNREIVGVVGLAMEWTPYFENLLSDGIDGIVTVLRNHCSRWNEKEQSLSDEEINVVSFEINGPKASFLGEYDAHDPEYDSLEVIIDLVDFDTDYSKLPSGQCIPKLSLHLFPTKKLEETFYTTTRYFAIGLVSTIFGFTSLVFLLYDHYVGRRQRKVMDRVMKQDKIVSNVFPTAIRDRLYGDINSQQDNKDSLDINAQHSATIGVAPMADLFPNTTIVFADISDFTAWASVREPQQVFTLLETIYGEFDKLAYRHGIFKVETVGDCYVAAAGLPHPMEDHAIAATTFSRACLKKMKEITLNLEVSLGPGTSDLSLRVGINSGQVTAGVLRGERARFQLFGDTMNTASRMESTGRANCIHISQSTADLLKDGGFGSMIIPRKQKTNVKGKGQMQTYWLRTGSLQRVRSAKASTTRRRRGSRINEEETDESSHSASEGDIKSGDICDIKGVEGMNKIERLIEWNVEVLCFLLQQIITSREENILPETTLMEAEKRTGSGRTVLEEFIPIIPLKRIEANDLELNRRHQGRTIDISDKAKSQLRCYLSKIASMYQDNPFHNFEHASHVTSSVKKLLKRIVTVERNSFGDEESNKIDLVDLAGHSYGITSDPLTQFAVVFSAIIHDVDHPGVPNAQLVKENTKNAIVYKKSVAEQNSVALAWEMLMRDEYAAFRTCIYQSKEDLKRFRQLVVNTVLATDIVDKELQALRKARWYAAFSHTQQPVENRAETEDRKATIVIEHLIQASDVSHTMQHWNIYKKWNERFFMECYGAYKAGRADGVDPSTNWYTGEIGFFDFYVIPLAKKLDDCGVFGVSSHEYLNYAIANRDEWIREGENIVKMYLDKYNNGGQ